MKRKNVKGLALTPAAPKPPPTAENANLGSDLGAKGEENTAQLEIGIEFNLDLKPEDLEIIKDLGAGNGGSVSKVRHIPTSTVMARKVSSPRPRTIYPPSLSLSLSPPLTSGKKIIHVEAKEEMRKRIVRELQIMHGCHSDYIVTFYGAFLNDNHDVIMCMEYMDVG